MTENDEKLLAEFEFKMRQLMYLCDTLKEENTLLKRQIEEKDTAIDGLASEVEKLKAKYDNLKFVKSLSSRNGEEMTEAKRRLSKLVRDVDKCIAMLKN
jgi:chromosome segregation ATPase